MLAQGVLLGFAAAAPVGPIGLLCIQRTLHHGRKHGFVSGLGAASADSVYSLVAALGLTALTSRLLELQWLLQLGGGLFLLYFGFRTARAAPATRAADAGDPPHLFKAYLSIFLLTLANPATILAFLALFAGLGVNSGLPSPGTGACALVIGVFLGSAAWWLLLSLIAGWLRHLLAPATMRLINLISGFCIGALGAWALFSLLRAHL